MPILGQSGIKDGVRNGVTDFVRMTFTNGFRGKDETARHDPGVYQVKRVTK